jgi:preprotein translocase subunit SecG
MLIYLLVFLHIVVCVVLILVVLLQQGKGADWAGAFGGGGSQTVFGPRGAGNFLSKATTAAAIIFMLTSLTLTIMLSQPGGSSVIREDAAQPAPSVPAAGTTGTGAKPDDATPKGAEPKPQEPSKADPSKK